MNALMNNGLILCLMTAVGFGSWPMIARFAGTNNAWTGFLVMGGTAFLCAIFYRQELSAVPSSHTLGLLALAGIANGIGMIAYTRLITDQQFGMSSYAPAALTLMVVFVTIVGALIFREPFPATKLLGLCLAVAGTWLMVK
ncbi:EamA family transporter [Candidatus Uhrbacteria bacterium]|nr:EamA family transporter [Candidatus Uhrbacteria bacterium]